MKFTYKLLPVAAAMAVTSGLNIPTAYANDAEVRLEEVIVTARKRLELEQDVPIATTVFSETDIERIGIERPQDFINLTSNVSIVDSANAGDTQVTIRGITSTRDAEGTFAYVVDGVLVTNPNGFNGELFDVQSIEVLKGPQGAIYGRNAVAGAILVNTKEPTSEFSGSARGGLGTDGLEKTGLTISGPLGDSVRAKLSVSTRDYDGQFSNDYTGQDDVVDFLEEDNVRTRFIWDATDNLTIDTTLGYRKVEGGAINFNAVFALPGAAAITGNPDYYKDVNEHDFRFQFNVPGENEQENTSFSIKADYDLDWATVTAIGSYDNLEEHLLSDGTSAAFGIYSFDLSGGGYTDGPAQQACADSYANFDASLLDSPFYTVPGVGSVPGEAFDAGGFYTLNALLPPYSATTCDGYQYQERNQESTSLELRIASEELDDLSWMAGIYLSKIEREVVVSYGSDLGDGYFGRKPYVPGRTDSLFWDDFETDVAAIFGSLEWTINDEHSLSLAARYDEEEREVSNNVPNVQAATAFGGISPITFGPATLNPAYDGSFTDTIADRDEKFTQFQPKVTWKWSLMDEASVYASYGVGFRSGGFNNIGSSALVDAAYANIPSRPANLNDDYEKEVSKSLEVGFKSAWMNNRIKFNAAAFRTEVEDSQFFNFLAGSFGILRVVTNIDEVTLQGIEMDIQAAVTPKLTAYGSMGMTDSEIEKNTNRPYTEGNDMPLSPDMTANLGLQWVEPIAQGMDLVARVDWQYVGETWFSTVQNETTTNAFTDISPIYEGLNGYGTPPGIPDGEPLGFGTSTFDKGERDDYDIVNMRVSLEAADWTVTAWGNNIFDKEYLEEIIPAPEFGGYFIHPAKGESYGVDVVYRF
ncbi:TonB-dependent receptor [bacterium]|nr:TonB-dependent receptor [bacterium]